jgi:dUTP pyrophosphatase
MNEIDNCGYTRFEKPSKRYDYLNDVSDILCVKKIEQNAVLPTKAYDGDAGYDLYCIKDFTLSVNSTTIVNTGIAVEIPSGYVGLIWDRSSMGAKGIKVLGGVIDSTYRGELKVILYSLTNNPYFFPAGSKIAQLLIQKVENMAIREISTLTSSERDSKGFGSSGV